MYQSLNELPEDILLNILNNVSPSGLLNIASSGEKRQNLRRAAFQILWSQGTEEALKCQRNSLEYWMKNSPSTFIPEKKIIFKSLLNHPITNQLMALELSLTPQQRADVDLKKTLHQLAQSSVISNKLKELGWTLTTEDVDALMAPLSYKNGHDQNTTLFILSQLSDLAPYLNLKQLDALRPYLSEMLNNSEKDTSLSALPRLIPRFNPNQREALIQPLQYNLTHQDLFIRRTALRMFPSLVPYFSHEQLGKFIPIIQNNLAYEIFSKHFNAVYFYTLQTIPAIAPRLNLEEKDIFLHPLLSNLTDENKYRRHNALTTFISFVPYINPEQRSPFIPIILNHMVHKDSSTRKLTLENIPSLVPYLSQVQKALFIIKLLKNNILVSDQSIHNLRLRTLAAFAPHLNPQQRSIFLQDLRNNLAHTDNERRLEALKILVTIIDALNPTQRSLFIQPLLDNLFHQDADICCEALQTFSALAPYLSFEQLNTFIQPLLSNLTHGDPDIHWMTLEAFSTLAHRLEHGALEAFIKSLEESFDHSNQDVQCETLRTLSAIASVLNSTKKLHVFIELLENNIILYNGTILREALKMLCAFVIYLTPNQLASFLLHLQKNLTQNVYGGEDIWHTICTLLPYLDSEQLNPFIKLMLDRNYRIPQQSCGRILLHMLNQQRDNVLKGDVTHLKPLIHSVDNKWSASRESATQALSSWVIQCLLDSPNDAAIINSSLDSLLEEKDEKEQTHEFTALKTFSKTVKALLSSTISQDNKNQETPHKALDNAAMLTENSFII